jgi:hypothetical protein
MFGKQGYDTTAPLFVLLSVGKLPRFPLLTDTIYYLIHFFTTALTHCYIRILQFPFH